MEWKEKKKEKEKEQEKKKEQTKQRTNRNPAMAVHCLLFAETLVSFRFVRPLMTCSFSLVRHFVFFFSLFLPCSVSFSFSFSFHPLPPHPEPMFGPHFISRSSFVFPFFSFFRWRFLFSYWLVVVFPFFLCLLRSQDDSNLKVFKFDRVLPSFT